MDVIISLCSAVSVPSTPKASLPHFKVMFFPPPPISPMKAASTNSNTPSAPKPKNPSSFTSATPEPRTPKASGTQRLTTIFPSSRRAQRTEKIGMTGSSTLLSFLIYQVQWGQGWLQEVRDADLSWQSRRFWCLYPSSDPLIPLAW